MARRSVRPADPPARSEAVPPLEEPWRSFRETYLVLRSRRTAFLAQLGLSVSEYIVLDLCHRSPATPMAVAAAAGVTPAGATDIIDRLERRRLARRASHPEDRRSLLVSLTPAGERLYRTAKAQQHEIFAGLFGRMTPSERKALASGLAALHRALERLPP